MGKNPTSVTTADFNQDGFTDLITTSIGDNSLSVLFGNGDGTCKEEVRVQTCKEPRALAANDYDGDGRSDLAVACSGSNQLAIFNGPAKGALAAGGSTRFTESRCQSSAEISTATGG